MACKTNCGVETKFQHFLINLLYLAGEAVVVAADGAPEVVDVVLKNAPAPAVRSLAVESILDFVLGLRHRLGLQLLVQLGCHQLKLKISNVFKLATQIY
jgi:hypothetical protein